jgi:hypothetical protein
LTMSVTFLMLAELHMTIFALLLTKFKNSAQPGLGCIIRFLPISKGLLEQRTPFKSITTMYRGGGTWVFSSGSLGPITGSGSFPAINQKA